MRPRWPAHSCLESDKKGGETGVRKIIHIGMDAFCASVEHTELTAPFKLDELVYERCGVRMLTSKMSRRFSFIDSKQTA